MFKLIQAKSACNHIFSYFKIVMLAILTDEVLVFFRLFPIISTSQILSKLSNLEKIGIDEKVICYHNISN